MKNKMLPEELNSKLSILNKENEQFRFIQNLINEMLDSDDLANLYKLLVNHLKSYFPNTIIIYISLNEQKDCTKLEAIGGINSKLINRIKDEIGFDFINGNFKVIDLHKKVWETGKLYEFENGLVEFVNSSINKSIAKSIEKLLNINKVYSIGVNNKKTLFSAIHFFTLKKKTIQEKEFVQNIVKQTGPIIQKFYAENQLKINKSNLKVILSNSFDSIWSIDSNYNIKYVNENFYNAFYNSFGVKLTKGTNLYESLPNFLKPVWKDRYDKTLNNESLIFCDEIPTIDSYIYIEVATKPIIINGKVIGASFYGKDITKRKLAEEALIESEEKARLFIENTPLPIAMFDSEMRYIITSKRWIIDYGLLDDNIIGRSHYDVFPEIPDNWKKDHQRVLNGEIYKNEADKFIREDGRIQWLRYELRPWYKKNNTIGGLIMFTEHITDKIHEQEALRISEQKLKNIFKVAPVGIGIISNRIILEANSYITTILGYSKSEIENKNARILYNSEEEHLRVEQIFNDQISKNGTCKLETIWKHKNGTLRNIFLAATSINLIDGQKSETFVALDITNNKNSEKELIIAKNKAEESDRLKSAFLANMSHEIRTPLNGILGFSELLKEPDLLPEEQNKYIKIIEQGGNRLLNIINDIINISKIESGQTTVDLQEVNISDQIEYIVSFFTPECNDLGIAVNKIIDIDKEHEVILTDKEKVYAILTNLMKNAIKFTEKGQIEIGIKRDKDLLLIYVKDTGIGIDKKKQAAIFERFIQADVMNKSARQGTGLGLSISEAYVHMLGGKMWLESEVGIGSTFYFSLPLKNTVPIK